MHTNSYRGECEKEECVGLFMSSNPNTGFNNPNPTGNPTANAGVNTTGNTTGNPTANTGVNNPTGNPPINPGVNNTQNWGNPNQPRASLANGPMHVNDPNGLLTQPYTPGAHNSVLLNNIRQSLEHQYIMGNHTLTRHMFTEQQKKYIIHHLYYVDRQSYDRLFRDVTSVTQQPK